MTALQSSIFKVDGLVSFQQSSGIDHSLGSNSIWDIFLSDSDQMKGHPIFSQHLQATCLRMVNYVLAKHHTFVAKWKVIS